MKIDAIEELDYELEYNNLYKQFVNQEVIIKALINLILKGDIK